MGEPKKSLFDKLKRGLFMTHTEIIEKVKESLTPDLPIDQSAIDGLEEGLLGADVGAELTMSIIDRSSARARREDHEDGSAHRSDPRGDARADSASVRRHDRHRSRASRPSSSSSASTAPARRRRSPSSRSAGRTKARASSSARPTRSARRRSSSSDVGRARGVRLVKHKAGADPARRRARRDRCGEARGADVVIIDTAGRLHNKHLMQELAKIRRVIDEELPGAPHETLLVLDGTTGQNGVSQAAAFLEAAKVTGMVVTKLDGTAKGGVILSIMRQFDIPVKFVGVGEARTI
jgi:fused signal recognition particle receptor